MALNITASGGSLNIVSVANIETAVFRGEGLDDGSSGGTYTGTTESNYEIIVDSVGGTDTFKWKRPGQDFVEGVAMTGGAQNLDQGATITFGATTGHDLYDRWFIRATAPSDDYNHNINYIQIRDILVNGNSIGIDQLNKDSVLWISYLDVLTPSSSDATDLKDQLLALISNDEGTATPGSGVDTQYQLAAATSTTVLAADSTRIGASITNNSDQVVQISYGGTASATSFSVALDPRSAAGQPVHYLEIPDWAIKLEIEAHSVDIMSGDNNLQVNEVTP